MNKKFSTLAVGLLLAGGLFSTVNAEDLTVVADNGRYYTIHQVADWNSSWGTAFDAATQKYALAYNPTSKQVEFQDAPTGDNAVWKVAAVSGKTGYYTLTTKAGNVLKITDGDAVISEFMLARDATAGVNALSYLVGTTTKYVACEATSAPWVLNGSETVARGVDADEADLAAPLTAGELNAKLAQAGGFKLSIGNLTTANDDNTFKAYDTMLGDVFVGTLKAVAASSGATTYALKNGSKNIVLTTAHWDDQNTDHAGEKGYKFTLMTDEELALQEARDAAQPGKKVILTKEFQISANEYNQYLEVVAVTTTARYELLVSSFNKNVVLTVDGSTANAVEEEPDFNNSTNKTYVKFGAGQLVDMKKFIVKDSYYTVVETATGKALANTCNGNTDFVSADQVQLDMPEGMWAISYNGSGNATLRNRESNVMSTVFEIDPTNFYYVEGKEDVYELGGVQYTIKAHAIEDLAAGYADFGKTSQKSYTIGVYSPVWKGVAYLAENHVGKHQIGLDTDAANATAWRLEPQVESRKVNPVTDALAVHTDSVYVISTLSYWGKKDNVDQWLSTDDTLKIVSYKIKNAATGEYVGYNKDSKYYACNQTATRFAFKKVGETYNMVEVKAQSTSTAPAKLNNKKVYGGDSATDGLLNRVSCMYERTENDLFKVEIADAAIYRRLDAELDTISIFRNENASQLLYEDGIFLGLKNENQFDIAPAMLADAAYAPEDTDRPQYMLVLNPTIVPAGTYCPVHGADATCEHVQDTPGWVEGRFLVNLKDTAIAFAAKPENLHKANPYVNTEGLYRLGFVPATHKEDYLAIAAVKPTAADTITVGKEDYNVAKFAFKYVDREAGSFVIETANYNAVDGKRNGEGYVKWMNGVVVVVPTEANADVFNLNADEDRNPTANEAVAASEVSVVAVNGAIIVKGAAGKVITVANILGQTIANQVAASDNVTIAAPAGIAVVTVDGEATKVVVK